MRLRTRNRAYDPSAPAGHLPNDVGEERQVWRDFAFMRILNSMNWRLLSSKDIGGLVVAVFIVCGLLLVCIELPNWKGQGKTTNAIGFDPEWICTYPGKGDPICVKKHP